MHKHSLITKNKHLETYYKLNILFLKSLLNTTQRILHYESAHDIRAIYQVSDLMSQDISTVDTTSIWLTVNLGKGKMTFETKSEVD